jgi:hypothetical protein
VQGLEHLRQQQRQQPAAVVSTQAAHAQHLTLS